MNLLNILYCLAALSVGAIIGLVIEYFIDLGIVRDLQSDNRRLRLENAQLQKEVKIERIEIVDNRTKSSDFTFGGF